VALTVGPVFGNRCFGWPPSYLWRPVYRCPSLIFPKLIIVPLAIQFLERPHLLWWTMAVF